MMHEEVVELFESEIYQEEISHSKSTYSREIFK
jgi:hypothetical protein